ncbi:MAG: hypothetical protein K8S54_19430 [Spirochaetia bacterium]|nr:hypothetical protein [Spirochaetia bacterium]
MRARKQPRTLRNCTFKKRLKLAACCSVLVFYSSCSRINLNCAPGDVSCSPLAWMMTLYSRSLNAQPCGGIGFNASSFHSYLSSGLSMQGNALCALKDGGLVAVGETDTGTTLQGKAPLIAHSGSAGDAMVVKWDSGGNVEWFTYLGTGSSNLRFDKIAETAAGGVVLLGYMNGPDNFVIGGKSPILPATSGDDTDIYIALLRADGSLAWHTALGGGASGNEYDNGGVVVAGDGSIYISGTAGSGAPATMGSVTASVPFTAGDGNNIIFAKLSADGTLLHFRYIGGGGTGGSYYGLSLAASGDGFVIAGDALNSPQNTIDGHAAILPFTAGDDRENLAVKVDPGGNILWLTYLGGGGAANVYNHAATASLHDGSVIVAANSTTGINTIGGLGALIPFSSSDGLIFKLSPSGQLQWFTYLGGGSALYTLSDVRQAADGGILTGGSSQDGVSSMGGVTERAPCGGATNCTFLAKLGTSGNLEWFTHASAGAGSTYAFQGIAPAADGGLLGIGYAQNGASTLQGRTPLNPFQAGDTYDLFMMKVDLEGRL